MQTTCRVQEKQISDLLNNFERIGNAPDRKASQMASILFRMFPVIIGVLRPQLEKLLQILASKKLKAGRFDFIKFSDGHSSKFLVRVKSLILSCGHHVACVLYQENVAPDNAIRLQEKTVEPLRLCFLASLRLNPTLQPIQELKMRGNEQKSTPTALPLPNPWRAEG